MGVEIARLLIAGSIVLILGGCDGGDKGNTAAPQATAAPSGQPAKSAEAPLNSIDRSFAGTPAPDVTWEKRGGGTGSMADYKGKRVLVNLWATWCAPCIAEMPELDALAAKRGEALVVLPVSQDMEGWQAVNGFFSPGKFRVLVPVLDQPGSLGERLKVRGLPVSVLYDEAGKEIWRVSGTPDWAAEAEKGTI